MRVCAENSQGSYSFRCPDCRMAIAKTAETHVVDVLVSSGVAMQVWHLPDELSEAHDGPPITHDDILDFHLLLQGPDWFLDLAAPVRPPLGEPTGTIPS